MHWTLIAGLIATPTYCKDISPILQRRCQVCHHPGTAAPFSLMTYRDTVKWADNIREAVVDGRMPPWFADPRFGKFSNDRHLFPRERKTLLAWIEAGTPWGDGRDLPPPEVWDGGWTIGTPDLVVEMPGEQYVPESGTVPYKVFSAKVPWWRDAFITAVEIMPGERGVLHHCEVFIDSTQGAMVVSYAPGSQALVLPPDTACRVPAGHALTWLMHYTPNGKAVTDRSRIGFRFWKGVNPPTYVREILNLQTFNIHIPPGSPNSVVENEWLADGERALISIRPHMHLRGKDFRFEVHYPDGRRECLLHVPRYDFNWQVTYEFADPPRFPKGTKLHFTSHYDNSSANPANPDPTKYVTWGLQTEDEMQTVLLDVRYTYHPPVPESWRLPDLSPYWRKLKWEASHPTGEYWWVSLAGLIPLTALVWIKRRSGPPGKSSDPGPQISNSPPSGSTVTERA